MRDTKQGGKQDSSDFVFHGKMRARACFGHAERAKARSSRASRPLHPLLSVPAGEQSDDLQNPLQGREESGGGMYNVVKIFVVSRGVWLYPHSASRLMKLLPGRATCLLRPGEAEISLCSVWRDPRCCGPALGAGLICPRQAWVAEVMMDAQTQRQLSLICVYGLRKWISPVSGTEALVL